MPPARNRRTSEGCPGAALRATRGTAIISLTVTLLGCFLKDSIVDINIGAYIGSVEVAALKDIILGVVFGGGVLAEV